MTLFETNHGYTVMDSIATSLKAIAKELHIQNELLMRANHLTVSDGMDIVLTKNELDYLRKEK